MPAGIEFALQERLSKHEFIDYEVWNVPPSKRFPDGSKFAFVYIVEARGRVYGVDNHHGLGVHEHLRGQRQSIAGRTWQEALAHFRFRLWQEFGHRAP